MSAGVKCSQSLAIAATADGHHVFSPIENVSAGHRQRGGGGAHSTALPLHVLDHFTHMFGKLF